MPIVTGMVGGDQHVPVSTDRGKALWRQQLRCLAA